MEIRKIEDNDKVLLTDVQAGTAFEYEGKTYLKTTEYDSNTFHYTCVSMDNGELLYIVSDTLVLVRNFVLQEVE